MAKKKVNQLKQTYRWKPNARVHAKPEIAAKAIDEVRKAHKGTCRSEDLLDAARKKTHPLHKEFIWDDHLAAEEQRKTRAGYIIRSLEVVVVKTGDEETVERSVTIRHSTSIGKGKDARFYDTRRVLSDEELRVEALKDVWNRLLRLRRQYADMVEFKKVWAAIDEATETQVAANG